MYVLDTNVLTYYLKTPDRYPYLVQKIEEADRRRLICTTIVNVQELLVQPINAIKNRPDQKEQVIVQIYEDLSKLLIVLKWLRVLPFDAKAYREFVALGPLQAKIGAKDRRIAAIALANGASVITANRQHFELVPDLNVPDWITRPQE